MIFGEELLRFLHTEISERAEHPKATGIDAVVQVAEGKASSILLNVEQLAPAADTASARGILGRFPFAFSR
ncbi:hypothetical protein ABWL39_15960 [Chitinivorax sp. PXF-14]|uniref:hypothetical protein n=1 Tax=Chitinivorax sp. PXF-14 TaxID=3230488 RepID=UPI003466F568